MKYLNPKADLTFKRVFGEHPDLVMSFLNALLPLQSGEEITEIEYLPAEMVPENPLRKNSIIDGLQLIFVELPKFTPHTYAEKKMHILWLRYLTEINEHTREVPPELLESPEIKKAVTALEESAFTPAQLLGYEKFWDIISVEKTLFRSAERKGRAEGRAEGWAQGRAEGREEGRQEGREEGKQQGLAEGEHKAKLLIAINAKKQGLSPDAIALLTGLSIEEIEKL